VSPMVSARRREGFTHDVEVDGHTIVVDEPEETGGGGLGPRPTQLVGAALAACTAITVEMYAQHKEWRLGTVEVDVDIEYEGPVPAVFTLTLKVQCDLDDDQLERLRVIAGKCPVHRALASETEVAIEDRIERVDS
jgi:putative redox protein